MEGGSRRGNVQGHDPRAYIYAMGMEFWEGCGEIVADACSPKALQQPYLCSKVLFRHSVFSMRFLILCKYYALTLVEFFEDELMDPRERDA